MRQAINMVTIVDYGAGNIFSIQNMLNRIGVQAVTAVDAAGIENAEKLILPGVGAFDTCMQKLEQSGMLAALHEKVSHKKTPVLGICAGMQLMTEGSEEGILSGLGWIKGKTIRFNAALMPAGYKIPHMGWAEVQPNRTSNLFDGLADTPRFYFVHAYYVLPEDEKDALAYARHGDLFVAALEHENILAVQFHPEKSHKYGMKLLENFVRYY